MKKLYAYLLKYNNQEPSYDLRFFEKEQRISHFPMIRVAHLDTEIPEEKCHSCGQVKK